MLSVMCTRLDVWCPGPISSFRVQVHSTHRFWGSDSGGQVRWQTPFPTEPSFQPPRMALYLLFYYVCMAWGYVHVNTGACWGQRHWLDSPVAGVTGSREPPNTSAQK